MELRFEKITEEDVQVIYDIQIEAFMPLLKKYEDYETNPANETIEKLISRINQNNSSYYKILADNTLVGAIRIFWKDDVHFWISPMFILPKHQGKGLAQKVIALVEGMFPQALTWQLATILEEQRNCYLYEKMGYSKTGVSKKLNDHTTLIYYKKVCN